jgi:DNA-binding CsgD family transcriptional regulator
LSAKPRLLVPFDVLVDGLRGSRPPDTAVGVVQISQLRKAIEPSQTSGRPQVLVRAEPGYRLVVEPDDVDAARFERLVADGRACPETHDPPSRRSGSPKPWRCGEGPALADVADEEAVRAEAQRLDGLRVLATEERVEADIALARHGELGELEAMVSEHPLRERLVKQFMVGLYRGADHSASAPWRARVQHDWAMPLGDRPDLIAAAQSTAVELGMTDLASRSRGHTPPAVVSSQLPDGLTARELDVLRLISTGRSNREIGAQMNLSQHTIANHVRNIL